ncbi:hypothetical protein [Aristophania vespae]|uniref:hypothetical protein n=1 Tax=Aristophania vespae TaxID=2697033 RepID=UPI0023511712|nr:hypothetical protein [Aristophania vespae]UMM63811.1 hypothetical protein DM15PD_07880 [Aristophania vespae]
MSKLLKTILGTIALTYCVSAYAKPFTNEDAIAVAESYKPDPDYFDEIYYNKPKSEKDLQMFIEEYQNAYAGDYVSWRNIATFIWKFHNPRNTASQIEACAWQSLVVQTKSIYKNAFDDREYIEMCERDIVFGKDSVRIYASKPVIKKRIAEIKKIINAHTVHLVDVEELDFDAKRDHDQAHAGLGWDYKY